MQLRFQLSCPFVLQMNSVQLICSVDPSKAIFSGFVSNMLTETKLPWLRRRNMLNEPYVFQAIGEKRKP